MGQPAYAQQSLSPRRCDKSHRATSAHHTHNIIQNRWANCAPTQPQVRRHAQACHHLTKTAARPRELPEKLSTASRQRLHTVGNFHKDLSMNLPPAGPAHKSTEDNHTFIAEGESRASSHESAADENLFQAIHHKAVSSLCPRLPVAARPTGSAPSKGRQ